MIPSLIYGTAWKEEKTPKLVEEALNLGFRAIDTANQRKHYFEEGVGIALQKYLGTHSREEIFLQSKFTYARSQDHRMPFKASDSLSNQVHDSFLSSLTHLNVNYLDSYILHGPYSEGFSPQDQEVWRAMEALFEEKKIRALGVSNVQPGQLKELFSFAKVKPKFAQIRTYAAREWEKETRDFCRANGILYQGFSLLTANRQELAHPIVANMAKKYGKTIPQLIFSFCRSMEIIPITGTTSAAHMKEDLASFQGELSEQDRIQLERIAF